MFKGVWWRPVTSRGQHYAMRGNMPCASNAISLGNQLVHDLSTQVVLYEVLQIFTQDGVLLLSYNVTRVKVGSLPFAFRSSGSIKVHARFILYPGSRYVFFCFRAGVSSIVRSAGI